METLDALATDHELIAFTGKGGVGKTTSAAATAVHLAEQGERTLLLSTDRSPSLTDVLGLDVDGEVTAVPEVDGLDAIEMDYDAIAARWKAQYGEEVYTVVSSFMPVDRWVVDYFAEAPGISTQFALSYLLEFFEGETYDRIVWDTAPAGSTIGLIELEEKLYAHLGQAPKFYAKLRAVVNRDVSMDPGELLAEWRELAQDCLGMVRSDRTTFVVVANPESLAVAETERIVADLHEKDIAVGSVIANGVLSASLCDCAFHRDRVAMQDEHLAELEAAYGDTPGMVTVPQLSTEVDGIESLQTVAAALFERESAETEN